MVFSEVIEDIMWASSHLECASTMMRYVCPINGPEKSRCRWLHAWEGHSHGCKGAVGGEDLFSWHI